MKSTVVVKDTSGPLAGRKLWIPRMTYVTARLSAAAFRAVGIDAQETPASDETTLELGGLHLSGEECYPEKVTIGDFLKIIRADDFDPGATAFFMPTAEGPCRFGQYAPYLRRVLDEMGYEDVPVVSPTSANSYDGMGECAQELVRGMWRAIVCADVLRKMLLKTRPYETQPGGADEAFERSIQIVEAVLERQGLSAADRLTQMTEAMTKARDLYRAVGARYVKGKPLIGVVGEIFCRLNTFSNYDAVRKIEAHGGEAWLSDVTEWVWYTNWSQKDNLRREGKGFSKAMLAAVIKNKVQRSDENALLKPFEDEFVGYEEPHDIRKQVLDPGWPYLPGDGALGEMALSVGKSIYMYNHGIDGIVDISPFACMNGIVSEAVYHAVSRDHDDLPIRSFYFDATSSNMERDLDIFMEMVRSYRKRKGIPRRYPAYFES